MTLSASEYTSRYHPLYMNKIERGVFDLIAKNLDLSCPLDRVFIETRSSGTIPLEFPSYSHFKRAARQYEQIVLDGDDHHEIQARDLEERVMDKFGTKSPQFSYPIDRAEELASKLFELSVHMKREVDNCGSYLDIEVERGLKIAIAVTKDQRFLSGISKLQKLALAIKELAQCIFIFSVASNCRGAASPKLEYIPDQVAPAPDGVYAKFSLICESGQDMSSRANPQGVFNKTRGIIDSMKFCEGRLLSVRDKLAIIGKLSVARL